MNLSHEIVCFQVLLEFEISFNNLNTYMYVSVIIHLDKLKYNFN